MPLILGDNNNHNHTAVRVGAPAPEFSLMNERGEEWRLSDKRGRVVALLFYPGDETLVCTRQMCSLRDHWAEYLKTGAEVVGISQDTVESHRHFAARHQLPLRLLADPHRMVTKMYSGHPLLPSWATRALTVIDEGDDPLSPGDAESIPREGQRYAHCHPPQPVRRPERAHLNPA